MTKIMDIKLELGVSPEVARLWELSIAAWGNIPEVKTRIAEYAAVNPPPEPPLVEATHKEEEKKPIADTALEVAEKLAEPLEATVTEHHVTADEVQKLAKQLGSAGHGEWARATINKYTPDGIGKVKDVPGDKLTPLYVEMTEKVIEIQKETKKAAEELLKDIKK